VVDRLIQEIAYNIDSNDPLKHLMLNNSTTGDENPEVAEFAKLFETSPPILLSSTKVELCKMKVNPHLIGQKLPR